jgi:co-chaperonin GroES (HSP10)
MKAVGNYIIIDELSENSTKTKGGLELAEKHRDDTRYRKAIVISSGPNIIKKNAQIIFDRVAGHDIQYQDVTYKVITIKDVIAVL